jgi:hypothetical protein
LKYWKKLNPKSETTLNKTPRRNYNKLLTPRFSKETIIMKNNILLLITIVSVFI